MVCWNWLLMASESQLCASLSNSMVSRYHNHGRIIFFWKLANTSNQGSSPSLVTLFTSTPWAYFKIIEQSCQDCYPPQRTCHSSHNREYLANTPQHFLCAKHYTILQHYSAITYTLHYSNSSLCIKSFNLHSHLMKQVLLCPLLQIRK